MGNEVESLPTRTLGRRLVGIAPWIVAVGTTGAGALALEGTARGIAVGAFVASSLGALIAITQLRFAIAWMRAWMGTRESALTTFADDRAAAVARQFAWAVDELMSVRTEHRRIDDLRVQAEERAAAAAVRARHDAEELRAARAKLAAVDGAQVDELRARIERLEATLRDEERDRRSAERRARSAEQRVAELSRTLRLVADTVSSGGATPAASASLLFEWTLEFDGMSHALRLRCTVPDVRPSRARVLDATGRLIAESEENRLHLPEELALAIPPSVAAAVEAGDLSAFKLEAEVDEAWRDGALVARSQVADAAEIRPRTIRAVS